MAEALSLMGRVSLAGPNINEGKATINLHEQKVYVSIAKADPIELRTHLTQLSKQVQQNKNCRQKKRIAHDPNE